MVTRRVCVRSSPPGLYLLAAALIGYLGPMPSTGDYGFQARAEQMDKQIAHSPRRARTWWRTPSAMRQRRIKLLKSGCAVDPDMLDERARELPARLRRSAGPDPGSRSADIAISFVATCCCAVLVRCAGERNASAVAGDLPWDFPRLTAGTRGYNMAVAAEKAALWAGEPKATPTDAKSDAGWLSFDLRRFESVYRELQIWLFEEKATVFASAQIDAASPSLHCTGGCRGRHGDGDQGGRSGHHRGYRDRWLMPSSAYDPKGVMAESTKARRLS